MLSVDNLTQLDPGNRVAISQRAKKQSKSHNDNFTQVNVLNLQPSLCRPDVQVRFDRSPPIGLHLVSSNA